MGARRSGPSTRPVVLDSDVLIWFLRGSAPARDLFEGIQPSRRVLSAVVRMELVRGARDRSDLRRLRRFCDRAFGVAGHVSEEVSRRATTLMERHVLSHRMNPDDALIAATALTLRASLATGNVKDYEFVSGLDVLPFRP